MSSFFDMLTALIALIISAAFLHFGGGEKTSTPDQPPQHENPAQPDDHAASRPASGHDDQRS